MMENYLNSDCNFDLIMSLSSMKNVYEYNDYMETYQIREIVVSIVEIVSKWYMLASWSRPKVFSKKGVLKSFTKFTGKHLCQSLIFNKIAG